jgi:hypothetical protein
MKVSPFTGENTVPVWNYKHHVKYQAVTVFITANLPWFWIEGEGRESGHIDLETDWF